MGRKKENRIYSMFNYEESTNRSKCLIEGCNVLIKGNHAGNLQRHFYAHHRFKHDEIVRLNEEDKGNARTTSKNAAALMGFCTDLVTVHGRPFNIVEDEAFKNIIKMIPGINHTDLQAINVKNIKENIRKKAYDVRLEISKELNATLVSLKVDVASVKLRRFLGLNMQYISDGHIILRNLSVVELHDRNTAEYLKENVVMTLSRYGIEPAQVLTMTTDNGSNMLSMVNVLNESMSLTSDDVPMDDINDAEADETIELQIEDTYYGRNHNNYWHTVRCSLFATCRYMQDFFEQCRQIIRILRTPNMSLRLKEEHLPQAVLDTPTRWDSTADMLENLKTLQTFCVANMTIEADIWAKLTIYLEILQPCRILSKRLQTEQLTCGDFYLEWMRCRHLLNQIDDAFARRLESFMVDRQDVLFENDHFLAAMYLDPRVNSTLDTNKATTARNTLVAVYKRIIKLSQNQQPPHLTPEPSSSSLRETETRTERQSFEEYIRHQFIDNARTNFEITIDNEIIFKLVAFLQEPVLPPNSNILEYWAGKKVTDPYLFKSARVVLATPPTSVSVERLFLH